MLETNSLNALLKFNHYFRVTNEGFAGLATLEGSSNQGVSGLMYATSNKKESDGSPRAQHYTLSLLEMDSCLKPFAPNWFPHLEVYSLVSRDSRIICLSLQSLCTSSSLF